MCSHVTPARIRGLAAFTSKHMHFSRGSQAKTKSVVACLTVLRIHSERYRCDGVDEDLTAGEKKVGVDRFVGAWCGGVWLGWPRRGMFEQRGGDLLLLRNAPGPVIRMSLNGLFEDPRKKMGVDRFVLVVDDGVGACIWTVLETCV